MFAVIKTGGKQYIIQEGDVLDVEKLDIEEGKKVIFDEVLLIEDNGETLIGTPHVKNAQVRAEVVDNFKDKKVIVFKKKKRKQYKKKTGHRQELTRVKIEQIVTAAKPAPKKEAVAPVKEAKEKAPAKKKEVVSKPEAEVKKVEKPKKEVKKAPAKKAKPQEKAKDVKPKEKKVKTGTKRIPAKSSAKTSAKKEKKT